LEASKFAGLNLDHYLVDAGDFVSLDAGLFCNGLFSPLIFRFLMILCYEGEDSTRLNLALQS